MFICTFQYRPEDVDCSLCAEYAHHRCTAENGCPYIAERIEAGVVDYGEIIWDTFKRPLPTMLRWRLRHLIDHYAGSMWRTPPTSGASGRCRPLWGRGKSGTHLSFLQPCTC